MQNNSSLSVAVRIRHRTGMRIEISRQGTLILTTLLQVVPYSPFYHLVVCVLSSRMLDVQKGEKDGKPLVEPELPPILTGDQITKPLMGQFVCIANRTCSEAVPSICQYAFV